MVKIAIAGGSGQVAREVIDALVASKKHEIIILSRKEKPTIDLDPGMSWKFVDYADKESLIHGLQGVHTLLSFVQTLSDANQTAQRNLIDAAISAGVKRFAPSEFGNKDITDMPWVMGKQKIREYLEEVNSTTNVLEYTLFQPGLFLDYLAYPYQTAKHVDPLQLLFDFETRTATIIEGHEDAVITLTTAADLAAIVARAVEYEGRWPTTGGIRGNRITFSQILDIGHRVRGRAFDVSREKLQDLEAGRLMTTDGVKAVHHAVAESQAQDLRKAITIGFLLSAMKGAWDSSDEMNQLFPDFKFTQADEFLAKVWEGKP